MCANFGSYYLAESKPLQTPQGITFVIGYSLQLEGKPIAEDTTYLWHRTWRNFINTQLEAHHYWLAFILLVGAMQAIGGEK